jgi:hypothetical protein
MHALGHQVDATTIRKLEGFAKEEMSKRKVPSVAPTKPRHRTPRVT